MLVIGNGESRKPIDISQIKLPTVGCNAIYRDYSVDHLVCVDKRMMQEALAAHVNQNTYLYTRKDWFSRFNQKRVRLVPELPYAGMERPDDPFHWGSGPYAVLLGATLTKTDSVGLLGFDLYGLDGKLNNVYKDTPNYKFSDSRAVDPRYWIYQIGKVFENFTKVKFTVYQTQGWQLPQAWNKPNVTVDTISNL